MNVRVDPTRCEYLPLTGNSFSTRTDIDGNSGLHVGVTGFTDTHNAAVLDTDIRFNNAPVIKNQYVGNYRIHRVGTTRLALPHAIADYFTAAKLHLVAIVRKVFFHPDDQVCVTQTYTITNGWAEHLRVSAFPHLSHDYFPQMFVYSAP